MTKEFMDHFATRDFPQASHIVEVVVGAAGRNIFAIWREGDGTHITCVIEYCENLYLVASRNIPEARSTVNAGSKHVFPIRGKVHANHLSGITVQPMQHLTS